MGVAWDMIRIKHQIGSTKHLDKRDINLTKHYLSIFEAFEKTNEEVTNLQKAKQGIPEELAKQHAKDLDDMEKTIHQLIIDEQSEITRDVAGPLNDIKIIEDKLKEAIIDRKAQLSQRGIAIIRNLLDKITIIETTLNQLDEAIDGEAKTIRKEGWGHNSLEGMSMHGEEGLLARLKRYDYDKKHSDAHLHNHQDAIERFLTQLTKLPKADAEAAQIATLFEKEGLNDLQTLGHHLSQRVLIGREIIHYYLNLYHKYHAYRLSDAEAKTLRLEERRMSKLFDRVSKKWEKTLETLKEHRLTIAKNMEEFSVEGSLAKG